MKYSIRNRRYKWFSASLSHSTALLVLCSGIISGCSSVNFNGFNGKPTLLELPQSVVLSEDKIASKRDAEGDCIVEVNTTIITPQESKRRVETISREKHTVSLSAYPKQDLVFQVVDRSQLDVQSVTATGKGRSNQCGMATPTIQIDQHGYSTQLWLNIIDDRLFVNTTMNIDIKMPHVGIKTDNGKLQRFAGNVFASNAVWSGSLVKTLKTSSELVIVLGGDELGKNTQEIAIDLKSLKSAYPLYKRCHDITGVDSI